jgi:hypothetical protein
MGQQYEVEKIIAHRRRAGRLEYRLRYSHYGAEDDTWEPASSLNDAARNLLDSYHLRRGLGAIAPPSDASPGDALVPLATSGVPPEGGAAAPAPSSPAPPPAANGEDERAGRRARRAARLHGSAGLGTAAYSPHPPSKLLAEAARGRRSSRLGHCVTAAVTFSHLSSLPVVVSSGASWGDQSRAPPRAPRRSSPGRPSPCFRQCRRRLLLFPVASAALAVCLGVLTATYFSLFSPCSLSGS